MPRKTYLPKLPLPPEAQDHLERAFNEGQTDAAAYAATTASDWNGTPPTTIQDAIDRLVAAVKAGSTSV